MRMVASVIGVRAVALGLIPGGAVALRASAALHDTEQYLETRVGFDPGNRRARLRPVRAEDQPDRECRDRRACSCRSHAAANTTWELRSRRAPSADPFDGNMERDRTMWTAGANDAGLRVTGRCPGSRNWSSSPTTVASRLRPARQPHSTCASSRSMRSHAYSTNWSPGKTQRQKR